MKHFDTDMNRRKARLCIPSRVVVFIFCGEDMRQCPLVMIHAESIPLPYDYPLPRRLLGGQQRWEAAFVETDGHLKIP
jgi:hypothetical protein